MTNIIEHIKNAWAGVPRPSREAIIVDYAEDEAGIRDYFSYATHWHHDPATLAAQSAAFTFFTSEAWRYWLPAFMICVLKFPDAMDVCDSRIAESMTDTYSSERLSLLSEEQRRVIARYFEERLHDRHALKAERDALNRIQHLLGEFTPP